MKINKDIEASEVRILREQYSNTKAKAKKGADGTASSADDSVQLPLGRAINDTAESIANDPVRAARIAEIKQILAKGGAAEYFKKVSSDDVASSVAEELTLEILSNKDKVVGGDDE